MATLPEVYSLQNIRRGFINPDFDTLEAALPPEDEEPFGDLRVIGERQLAISRAMPGAGLQGTFAYVYGSLSLELANGVHYRWRNTDLPEIAQRDELEIQAWYFDRTWVKPTRHYVAYRRAVQRGDVAAQQAELSKIGPQWMYPLDAPEVQFAEPVVQFGAGGMVPHIWAGHDLSNSCINSGVSAAYMKQTYPTVDKYIKIVTQKKAPELLEGNPRAVALMAAPVALGIAAMRWNTRRRYYEAKRQDDVAERERMFDRADHEAVFLSKAVVKLGGAAIGGYGLAVGPRALHRRYRQPAGAGDIEDGEAA